MKKLLLIVAVLAMLLAGCAASPTEQLTAADNEKIETFSVRAVDAWNGMPISEQATMCVEYEQDSAGTVSAFLDGFGRSTPDADLALRVFLAMLELNCP